MDGPTESPQRGASLRSIQYWRNRLAAMQLESDDAAIPESKSKSNPGSPCLGFTIHAGNFRIECQADSMHAIESVLAWASRNSASAMSMV